MEWTFVFFIELLFAVPGKQVVILPDQLLRVY